MKELTIDLLGVPTACMSCIALQLGRYCGLAYEGNQTANEVLRALASRNLSVPKECENDFGGLNAEEVRQNLKERQRLK